MHSREHVKKTVVILGPHVWVFCSLGPVTSEKQKPKLLAVISTACARSKGGLQSAPRASMVLQTTSKDGPVVGEEDIGWLGRVDRHSAGMAPALCLCGGGRRRGEGGKKQKDWRRRLIGRRGEAFVALGWEW